MLAPHSITVNTFISNKKEEPQWLLDWCLKAYRQWLKMKDPTWAKLDIEHIDYQAISYYSAPKSKDDAPGVVGTTTSYYENDAYGISFAVNDNLSVSYGKHESVQQNDAENTEVSAESFQVAYSMGGATVKMAETEVNNRITIEIWRNEKKKKINVTLSLIHI